MAPLKKTRSAPNKTASCLMKALKRNRSLDTGAVNKEVKKKATSTTSSPESVKNKEVKKKAISTTLQQQLSKTKKRKREAEHVPTKTTGLRLLKRGPVTMHRIVRRKMLGIKYTVNFNAKGEPYGKAATEMQSYIGVLARSKAPIWYDSWKKVPAERKKKIWDCVQVK